MYMPNLLTESHLIKEREGKGREGSSQVSSIVYVYVYILACLLA